MSGAGSALGTEISALMQWLSHARLQPLPPSAVSLMGQSPSRDPTDTSRDGEDFPKLRQLCAHHRAHH